MSLADSSRPSSPIGKRVGRKTRTTTPEPSRPRWVTKWALTEEAYNQLNSAVNINTEAIIANAKILSAVQTNLPAFIQHQNKVNLDHQNVEKTLRDLIDQKIKEFTERINTPRPPPPPPPPSPEAELVKALVEKVATLTTKVADLELALANRPAPTPIIVAPPVVSDTTSYAAVTRLPPKPTKTVPHTPPSKRDRTVVIERDGTPIPSNITPLVVREAVNAAIGKPLVAAVQFTAKHQILLVASEGTTSDTVLAARESLETAIRALLPSATGLRKDTKLFRAVVHNIPVSCTPDQARSEIQRFNPGTLLHCEPRWLTTTAARAAKSASSMVITIIGRPHADSAVERGLSLFGTKHKCAKYLAFGQDTQCTVCLKFGHHHTGCKAPQVCSVCAGPHTTHRHSCGRTDCSTVGKVCLHTKIQCANCGSEHRATSKECPTYTTIAAALSARKNQTAMETSTD